MRVTAEHLRKRKADQCTLYENLTTTGTRSYPILSYQTYFSDVMNRHNLKDTLFWTYPHNKIITSDFDFFFNMYRKLFQDFTNKFFDSNLWILIRTTLLETFIFKFFLEIFFHIKKITKILRSRSFLGASFISRPPFFSKSFWENQLYAGLIPVRPSFPDPPFSTSHFEKSDYMQV